MDVAACGPIGPAKINSGPSAVSNGTGEGGIGFGALLGVAATFTSSASVAGAEAPVGASPVLSTILTAADPAVSGGELIVPAPPAQQPAADATKASLLASTAPVVTTALDTLTAEMQSGATVDKPTEASIPQGDDAGKTEAVAPDVKLDSTRSDIPVEIPTPAISVPGGQLDAGEASGLMADEPLEEQFNGLRTSDRPTEDPTGALADAMVDPAVLASNKPHLMQATMQPQLQVEPQTDQAHPEELQDLASTSKQPGQSAKEAQTAGPTSAGGSAEPAAQPFPQLARNASADQPQANAVSLPGATNSASQQAPLGQHPAAPAQAHIPHQPVMPFRADKVAREMGLEIARRMSAGNEELVIRLDPAELGRINIRMAVNEHGHLRAVVAADAPSVLDALRSDISELTRALEQAGVRTDSQSFRFDRGGSGDSGGHWQQRYQQQASTRPGGDHASAIAEDEHAYRPMATNGRINVMA